MDTEKEIVLIHERNKRVELDKAWEVSLTRRGFIAATTYVIASAWLLVLGESAPLLKALIGSAQNTPWLCHGGEWTQGISGRAAARSSSKKIARGVAP